MRKVLIVAALVCFMAIPSMVMAQECDPEKSPTKVVVTIGGKDQAFCNLEDAYIAAFVKREGAKNEDLNDQVVPIQVKEFETGKMFNFYDGYYIIESSIEVKGSKVPYVPGFSTLESAWKYWEKNQAKIGGRVVNFETATREYATHHIGLTAYPGLPAASKKKEDAAAKHIEKLLPEKK